MIKPPLKYAGNKYRIASVIADLLPCGRRLIEPFVGSGAVFLNTDYEEYLLADINADLITLYQLLQSEGMALIDYCAELFIPENNTAERYYELRDIFNTTQDSVEKSRTFLYLNRHCFNGLIRFSKQLNRFNVPFGRYTKPYFPRAELIAFHQKTVERSVQFVHATFESTMAKAVPGDIAYADPPYVALSDTARFTNYSADGFTLDDQLRLAREARILAQRGVPVLISNHYTDFTVQAYSGAKIHTLGVSRLISRDSSNRKKVQELLALFLPNQHSEEVLA